MALSPLGTLDLSVVTDRLIAMLTDCINASSLWATLDPTSSSPKPTFSIAVSGAMPETTRKDSGCTLSICLLHVSADKFNRNFVANPSAPLPQRALKIPAQPLGLDLFYLLTAFDADNSYAHEQQAMSIALKCFHENPIVRVTVAIPPAPQTVQEEFTLTMEVQAPDDVSRLWDAITVPYRLSAFYKVSVVFMTPPAPPDPVKQAVRFSLAVDPASIPFSSSGQVIGTSSTQTFTSPQSTVAQPEIVNSDYSPAVVTPGQSFYLYGAGLNGAASSQVYLLLPPDYKVEQEVTSWKGKPNLQTDSRIVLQLPATIGVLPAAAPTPGIYQLRVGSGTLIRTNSTPFSIAARIDVSTVAPNPPVLPGGPIYTVTGEGFATGQTQVLLETVPLEESSLPGPCKFTVKSPQSIDFTIPVGLAPGTYALRIRVNQVETTPAWWVKV